MSKIKERDSKYIIYQVLYIFVIVMMTMKGADLNLDMMVPKDKSVDKTFADSLKASIDSLQALGLVPRVEFDIPTIDDSKLIISDGIKLTADQMVVYKKDYEEQKRINEEQVVKPKEVEKSIELKIVQPTQFTANNIKNSNSEPLQIYADNNLISTIPANSSGSYQLKGQLTVKYVCGSGSKMVETLPNQTQKISFQSFSAGGAEASLRNLQAIVGWRVTIEDDFIDNLDVKITGSVKAKQVGKGIYDVQLFICGSKDQFERIYGSKDAPYNSVFNVVTVDRLSGKTVTQQRSFQFGEW